MKKQPNPTIRAQLVQSAFYLLLLSAGTLLAFFHPGPTAILSHRTLTFAQRVAYQRAIEEVYWRHRIWPKENLDPKPSLDAVMSQAQLEKKVEDYLRESHTLEDYWQRPITAEDLQAEMDRMAKNTKQPDMLHELFEALGNDPFLIAECLARPVLSERLITGFGQEQQQGRLPLWEVGGNSQTRKVLLANNAYSLPTISDVTTGCSPDTWTATSTANLRDGRSGHTAVWTGSEMIIWGGYEAPHYTNTGKKYSPSTDSWAAINTTNGPSARYLHTAVWTGSEMIVWGGTLDGNIFFDTGGRYNPSTDSWTATSTTNAPDARYLHTAVWTGGQMIVWGGYPTTNTGGRYDPNTDNWTATSTTNAPSARESHGAVWTGSEMIVWGGFDGIHYLDTGGRYNPRTDSWAATNITNAPEARTGPSAVWDDLDNLVIVWGGYFYDGVMHYMDTGGRYNPGTDSWTATSTTNVPSGRQFHTAVWTDNEMIVWGGWNSASFFNTGGRYNPGTDSWTATSITNAPNARIEHTAVWTGTEMIIFGGEDQNYVSLMTGGRYCAQSGGPTPTAAPSATATATVTATPTVTPTPTASPIPTSTPTPTPTPTPCTGRCEPTPRPRPTPAPRP